MYQIFISKIIYFSVTLFILDWVFSGDYLKQAGYELNRYYTWRLSRTITAFLLLKVGKLSSSITATEKHIAIVLKFILRHPQVFTTVRIPSCLQSHSSSDNHSVQNVKQLVTDFELYSWCYCSDTLVNITQHFSNPGHNCL